MPQLARLQALHLTDCAIGDDGAAALAGCSYLSRLQTLRLGTNALTDQGVEVLAESPHLHHLQVLVLHGNLIGDAGAQILAKCRSLNLHTLDLSDNLIGDPGVEALAHALQIGALKRIDLSNQFKGPVALQPRRFRQGPLVDNPTQAGAGESASGWV
jgi:hypothetical protein